MTRYYSPGKGGFFDSAIHGDKGAKGSRVPKDAVELSVEDHGALLAEQADGKRIVAGDGGAPIAIVPEPTPEEVLAAVRARRDRELAGTDWTQAGDALDEEQRRVWAEHRQALRDLPALVEAAIVAGEDPAAVPYPQAPAIRPPSGGGIRQTDRQEV